jgi:hypothetical protein
MTGRSDDRLYRIQPHCGDSWIIFLTGSTPNGRQLLLGPYNRDLVAIWFSRTGEMESVERRACPEEVRPSDHSRPSSVRVKPRTADLIRQARQRDEALRNAAVAWAEQFGVRPAPIVVRRFFLEDALIGISDPAEAYARLFAGSDAFESEEEGLACWEQSGEYVLWWGREHIMNHQGKVVGT